MHTQAHPKHMAACFWLCLLAWLLYPVATLGGVGACRWSGLLQKP